MFAGDLHVRFAGARFRLLQLLVFGYRGDCIAVPQNVAPLATDNFKIEVNIVVLVDEMTCRLEHVGVEGSGKSLVAGDDDNRTRFSGRATSNGFRASPVSGS